MIELERRLVLVTEQAAAQILALDGREIAGSWRPPAEASGWGLPSDVRVRRAADGSPILLVADSLGYAGVVDASGAEVWSSDLGRAANPHAVETGGGFVFVAASDGGWVRSFRIGGGLASTFPLAGAHGVLWDDRETGLWMLGDDALVLADIDALGGFAVRRRVPLPTSGGHDLSCSADPEGRLWISTRSGVYRYDVSRDAWTDDVPLGPFRADVKSIGDDPESGSVVFTVADAPEWWTDTIRQTAEPSRVRVAGARIYKARWSTQGTR